MCIAEEHNDNGQAHTHFRSGYYHDKEYKQLPVGSGGWIGSGACQVMHFRERHQQQVNGVQHQLDTHKYDDGIAPGKHPYNANDKQGEGKKNVILDVHNNIVTVNASGTRRFRLRESLIVPHPLPGSHPQSPAFLFYQ